MVIASSGPAGFTPTHDDAQGQDMFQWLVDGRVAMQPDFGPWDIAKLAALKNPDINLVPDPSGGEPLEIDGLGISKTAKAPQTKAAKTFLDFMSTSTEAQNLLTSEKSSLGLPVIEKSQASFKANAPDLNLGAFITAVGQNTSARAVPNKDEILQSFWTAVNASTGLGTGNDDPATVFPTLQDGCQTALDKLIAAEKH
jgi:multiple sugar transport system substrate-binding protein